MGVRPATPLLLAHELCEPLFVQDNAPEYMTPGEAQDLLFRTLRSQPREGFFALEHAVCRKTAELMYSLFNELDAQDAPALGGSVRLDAVQQLRDAWDAARGGQKLNKADLLELALEPAREACAKQQLRVVTLSCCRFSKPERRLLEALAGEDLIIVPVEIPVGLRESGALLGGHGETISMDASTLRFARCRGKDTEARFILHDILDRGLLAEECAVVCMDRELSARLVEEAEGLHLPVASSIGYSLKSSLVYDALHFLQDWPATDYEAEPLRT